MENSNKKQMMQEMKVVTADPSALGLFGLAVITLVASSQKLGITEGYSLVIPWAIFLGALGQLFACVNDFKKNNAFGAVAFGGFGLFWLAVSLTWLIKMGALGEPLMQSADMKQFGFAIIGYLIFNIIMTIGAMDTNKALFSVFFLINFLFIGLILSCFGVLGQFGDYLAAYSELAISIASFYNVAAHVLNSKYNKTIIPIGAPFKLFRK